MGSFAKRQEFGPKSLFFICRWPGPSTANETVLCCIFPARPGMSKIASLLCLYRNTYSSGYHPAMPNCGVKNVCMTWWSGMEISTCFIHRFPVFTLLHRRNIYYKSVLSMLDGGEYSKSRTKTFPPCTRHGRHLDNSKQHRAWNHECTPPSHVSYPVVGCASLFRRFTQKD